MTILKGKKVLLRPTEEADAQRFIDWYNNKDVNQYLMWVKEPLTIEKEIAWIRSLATRDDWKDFVIQVIEGKTLKPIGNCALHNIDSQSKTAALGINIGLPDYWSKGYGTEVAELLIGFAFKILGFTRIESHVIEFNHRSLGLVKKLGYREVDRLKKAQFKNGQYWDEFVFVLEKDNWNNKGLSSL